MTDETNSGSILIEWDGGWETVDSKEAAEKFIDKKLEEWGEDDRTQFLVRRNVPGGEEV